MLAHHHKAIAFIAAVLVVFGLAALMTASRPQATHAQSASADCINYYTPTVAVPAGYGAAYDLFGADHKPTVQAVCNDGNPTLNVGRAAANDYIYKQGYIYQGNAWQPLPFTSNSPLVSSAWYTGFAQGVFASTTDLSNWTYAVGYICTWNGTKWLCGCHDATCATSSWQLQAFEQPGGDEPTDCKAAGYTYKAMDIENWTNADVDMKTGGAGFPWYEDGIWVTSSQDNQWTITNGQLVGNPGLTTASRLGAYGNPRQGGGPATFNPPANFAGAAYGPGVCVVIQAAFDPSVDNSSNWQALWGNTWGQINDNTTNNGSTEVDWAEFYFAMVPMKTFNTGLIDWNPGACGSSWCGAEGTNQRDYNASPHLNAPPFSNGDWDFNTLHTYAALIVPSQDNGGTGYLQTYVDGHPFDKETWTAGGMYSKLDTDPFIPEIGGSNMTLGHVQIYVKDQSKIIKGQ